MEPGSKPPWRVLDAPSSPGGAAVDPAAPAAARPVIAGSLLRVVATVGAAIACAIVAFALAVGGGSGGTVLVDGGSGLPVVGTSGDPAGLSGAGVVPVTGEIVVEVVGAVPRPGVFRLPAGSRIGDLVTAAGGYGPRVDTAQAEAELNLAATLQDGDRVRVPSRDDAPGVVSPGVAGAGGSEDPAGALVDINSATQAELEELPGIGPATAQKIMTAREEAPFASIDELRSRGVLGEKTFEKLRDLVAVS